MNPVLLASTFSMGPKDWAIVVLAIIAVVAIVKDLFRVDDRVEKRRRMAADAAKVMELWGLTDGAEVARCYSVGDYSGFAAGFAELVKRASQPESAAAMIRGAFRKMLVHVLKDPDELAYLRAELAKVDAAEAAKAAS